MKTIYPMIAVLLLVGCKSATERPENPFFTDKNTAVDYAAVTADDVKTYADIVMDETETKIENIKSLDKADFESVFTCLDGVFNEMTIASNNCFMLYWVSPDSLTRANGLEAYQKLSDFSTKLFSDKALYEQMESVKTSDAFTKLAEHEKRLVNKLMMDFERSGVNLEAENLERFKTLTSEINELSAAYSNNMNSADEKLTLDEKGIEGLPESFKNTYRVAENKYEVPVMNATNRPIMGNAKSETTRKEYYTKYNSRAADKNIEILNQMIEKRHELAQIMGYNSYAEYNLAAKMAGNPENVWSFLNDLVDKSQDKAIEDLKMLETLKQNDENAIDKTLHAWDIAYYTNQILKNEYNVDHEKIREYLPMEQCLTGVLDMYEQLLGYTFKKVENPMVWHKEVELYEVHQDGKLVGRFYLDLFPRPNKESWFYGVGISDGRQQTDYYQIPASMLLGNFTRPTDELPSLLSFKELNTLFHEFGHIMDAMSYKGEFSLQSGAKADFVESMSQIFENWTLDYQTLSSFAKHYDTGEVLPEEIFNKLKASQNVCSGYHTLSSLRKCYYDMYLYDRYDPENPFDTDALWKTIDKELGLEGLYVEGTHPQASWIHINTHPVYYYGYLWAEVYAQDMFTVFKANGLDNQETGIRFRDLILANGDQKDVLENVEKFLGRPSNNEAYIESLGLN
jgi:Zn-dependent oligopeptidase